MLIQRISYINVTVVAKFSISIKFENAFASSYIVVNTSLIESQKVSLKMLNYGDYYRFF